MNFFTDGSEESKENVTVNRGERRRQKKPQAAQRIPRSVSEEVLALEGKFQPPQHEKEASLPTAQASKRTRRARRRGIQFITLVGHSKLLILIHFSLY